MWFEGGWTGSDNSVLCSIVDSPMGPFNLIGMLLLQNPNIAKGGGHHSGIQITGADVYFIVYHRHPLNPH